MDTVLGGPPGLSGLGRFPVANNLSYPAGVRLDGQLRQTAKTFWLISRSSSAPSD